ncbi:hypothetical protein MRX96_039921 [Rhipicephalus microplus]
MVEQSRVCFNQCRVCGRRSLAVPVETSSSRTGTSEFLPSSLRAVGRSGSQARRVDIRAFSCRKEEKGEEVRLLFASGLTSDERRRRRHVAGIRFLRRLGRGSDGALTSRRRSP